MNSKDCVLNSGVMRVSVDPLSGAFEHRQVVHLVRLAHATSSHQATAMLLTNNCEWCWQSMGLSIADRRI